MSDKIKAELWRFTLADGSEHDVRTDVRDYAAWDVARARNRWPMLTEANMLWLSWCVWHAAKRDDTIPDLGPFDPESVPFVSLDQVGTETVDPTRATAGGA